jgi:hypothetical protein
VSISIILMIIFRNDDDLKDENACVTSSLKKRTPFTRLSSKRDLSSSIFLRTRTSNKFPPKLHCYCYCYCIIHFPADQKSGG